MNPFKKYASVLLMLAFVLSVFSGCGREEPVTATEAAPTQIQETVEIQASEETAASGYYQVGDKIEDFTVTTYDGREINLYKVLEEKDMVLLNLWATWCGPCGSEFPAMQEAYEQYQDKLEIIALSVEPTDTDEVLADYVQEKGMSFCVASDTAMVGSRFFYNGIPTSVVVDRFGIICMIEEGAVPYPSVFTNIFGLYTAEDYTESLFLPSMFAVKPTAEPADPAALNEALNGEDGTLEFRNSSNVFCWPMTVEQKDGRSVAVASNGNTQYSKAVVETQVDVKAGDVLVMDFKMDNNIYTSVMSVEVDGRSVKKFSATRDWGTYAYQFEENGNHRISICFEIDWIGDGYCSNLWIDSIRVVSDDEAVNALENNPKYPVGEESRIQLLNENVKTAQIYDEAEPDFKELVYFCGDPTLRLRITLDDTMDPEITFLEDGNYNMHFITSCVTEDGFVLEVPNTDDSDAIGGGFLYCDGTPYANLYVFSSEEHINQYFDRFRELADISYKWEYVDETADLQNVSGDVTYTVTYVDQDGDPVPGVMCQVCDDSMCQVFVSDANGICEFTLPANSYEIHTLKLPEGYEGDTDTVTKAPVQGGELNFTLTKK